MKMSMENYYMFKLIFDYLLNKSVTYLPLEGCPD